MVTLDLKTLFLERCGDSRLNTSYPLSPSDWAAFRVDGPLPFDERTLSFYIHIPFCRRLCTFCEYTRTTCPSIEDQKHYVHVLRSDIFAWMSAHPGFELKGFDIGGGTPTSMDGEAFRNLMDLFSQITESVPLSSDFEPSIEGTFQTIDKEKLRAISDAGIERVSLGLQAASMDVLEKVSRDRLALKDATAVRRLIRDSGIHKLNIDLMYGLPGKTASDALADLHWIKELAPEQVTLYEFRPNMLSGEDYPHADERYEQYCILFDGLQTLGYAGLFGANTFSLDGADLGVSSYLRSRMCDGVPYKGFGVSAQSMSAAGVSYNTGKGAKNLSGILGQGSLPEEYTYRLPREELLAKYICISAYYGRFSLTTASSILGRDYMKDRMGILRFLQKENLISIHDGLVSITREGFRHYGAVFSFLYGKDVVVQ